MAGQQLTGSFGTVMDGLVAGARADRDAAVNTLDAVDRQAKAAREQIGETVVVVRPPEAADLEAAAAAVRDDRFDPEEWGGTQPSTSGSPHVPPTGRARQDDDEDDYPETWLR